MAQNSAIEWTDNTANFWWGCFKVSRGCEHCYADTLAKRYGKSIWGPVKTTDRELKKGIWKELPKWNERAKANGRREKVFVMSMGDFFEDHPQVKPWRDRALDLISNCERLDFQVLTKRPENVNRMLADYAGSSKLFFMHNPNVWIGTSVENQEQAYKRIPALLNVPAAVRFLSCEPLLGPVDLRIYLECEICANGRAAVDGVGWVRDELFCYCHNSNLHLVIVGGESGPRKRPFNPDWARSIRDQCQAAGVPFFMKQWDKVQPIPDDLMIRQMPQEATNEHL